MLINQWILTMDHEIAVVYCLIGLSLNYSTVSKIIGCMHACTILHTTYISLFLSIKSIQQKERKHKNTPPFLISLVFSLPPSISVSSTSLTKNHGITFKSQVNTRSYVVGNYRIIKFPLQPQLKVRGSPLKSIEVVVPTCLLLPQGLPSCGSKH